MNRYAYRTTGYAVKALTWLSNANIRIHHEEKIPDGSIIYAINHFTRIETVFIPYHIRRITGKDIWSLADAGLFEGVLGSYLNEVGALSTKNPDRDKLIVRSLLTGEASWIIFPEGWMVKNKKIYDKNGKKQPFVVASPEGRHAPHTGAATLALRTEFYRERIKQMIKKDPAEARRILELFKIDTTDTGSLFNLETYIVPVNLTYYPIRAKENILSRMAEKFFNNLSERMVEEIMTEGSMLLSGVDVDLCFGNPIKVSQYMKSRAVKSDIESHQPINFDDQIPSRSMLKTSAMNIMHRYMSSIYRMTAVNHDHLFASLLKYIPYYEIDEDDLRRRAFIATTIDFQKKDVFLHDMLRGNQINLLT
ncbi:MAG: glycerol acyltransferase, partial [Deltaproteobacteria bacterium]|nr:glycerol acyltransferase [Deltaproteobacteria bacterium]